MASSCAYSVMSRLASNVKSRTCKNMTHVLTVLSINSTWTNGPTQTLYNQSVCVPAQTTKKILPFIWTDACTVSSINSTQVETQSGARLFFVHVKAATTRLGNCLMPPRPPRLRPVLGHHEASVREHNLQFSRSFFFFADLCCSRSVLFFSFGMHVHLNHAN